MKGTVLYTQRVEIIDSYNERRDCADQNIPDFIRACGYVPIPLPNIADIAMQIVDAIDPVGIMLTGGNNLTKYGGDAPERDETEKRLLDVAIERGIPVYGFCRGMQFILEYFGNEIEPVEGHVAIRHEVSGKIGSYEVNSFHTMGCIKLASNDIEVSLKSNDGVIEMISHKQHRIIGTMWHPEREGTYRDCDIMRVRNLIGGEK